MQQGTDVGGAKQYRSTFCRSVETYLFPNGGWILSPEHLDLNGSDAIESTHLYVLRAHQHHSIERDLHPAPLLCHELDIAAYPGSLLSHSEGVDDKCSHSFLLRGL
jgi:hypothetical protein